MSDNTSPILVTGGAGFIGSTFVRQWLAAEQGSMINLDKLTYAGHRESLGEVLEDPRHLLVQGDIADAQLVTELLQEHQPWAIVHLAAETHVDRSIRQPPQFVKTNVLGTCALLDRATHYWQQLDDDEQLRFRFLLVSTDEVFGTAAADCKFSRQSPLAPNSPYAASKAATEHLANAFAATYGLPVLIANPSNNYGPRQLPEKLIPKMILAAAAEEPLPLYGDGLHQRDWIHVDDCCRALHQILLQGRLGERYLIGADNCLDNLTVVETICDLVDLVSGHVAQRRKLISHVDDRPGHDRRYAVDASELRRSTGWEPQVPFTDGLQQTVRWYLEHPQWVQTTLAALAGE